jgi:hypothetical protein
LVNPWQPERVIGAVFVEVGVVDAHSPLVRVLLADEDGVGELLTVYFGTPNMFITLWFGFVYGTNPPLNTLII